MAFFKSVERLFAVVGLLLVGLMTLLWQTTGHTTPCAAAAVQAREHLPAAAEGVVEACLGHKGEGGLAGLVLDLGLTVAGQSREKVARRMEGRLAEQVRTNLADATQTRCLVILAEGVVGRSNGGPKQVALDAAEPMRSECRGDARK